MLKRKIAAIALIISLALPAAALPGGESYLAGIQAQREGRYGDAVRFFEATVVEEDVLAGYALLRMAQCRARGGDKEGATEEYRTVIRQHPEGPWVRMAQAELAQLLMQQERPDEAAPLFVTVLDEQLLPSWFRDISWQAAQAQTRYPPTALDGYNRYAELMASARWRRERNDTAERLVHSPVIEHRLAAIETLLDGGAYQTAGRALKWLKPLTLGGDETRARYAYLQGRFLLSTGQEDAGETALREAMTIAPGTVWERRALAHLAESLLSSGHPQSGVALLGQLVENHPGTEEVGEALWDWASYLEEEERTQEAAVQYARLAEAAPQHTRAPLALLRAGALIERGGDRQSAAEVYQKAAQVQPSGRYAPEAGCRRGLVLKRLGKAEQAMEAFQAAAAGPLGDFYVHRALEELAGSDAGHAAAGQPLTGLVGAALVRPKAIDASAPADPPEVWDTTPWGRRLYFFGVHGLEETEWEALYLAQSLKGNPVAPQLYHALAEAGAAGTAMEFADALGWGETDSGLTVDRLRVDFPRAYWEQVQAIAKETGLDPYLLLAVARQESLFRARAVSYAGATGVMQLMPSTAEWLVKVEPQIDGRHAGNLEVPANSLRLGAYYLMRQMERSNGNLVFAAASYNAGPGNVNKWKKALDTGSMDTFIDNIPFSETKNYVKRVLGNYAAYRSLYQNGT